MVVVNLTEQTEITTDLKEAVSLLDKGLGLLRPSNPRSLLFKTRFGVHTLGVRQSIDAVVLDGDFVVVKIKESLKPWRFFFWNPQYFWVMELPKGTIDKANIKIGDKLIVKG